jgi:glycosyltransferase involved in cell wall biosynthesis
MSRSVNNNSQRKVEVLLSTWNGVRYLPELLESVDGQSYSDFRLSIRDDGSVDGTVRLLTEFAARRTDVTLTIGKRLGPTKSFFTLLQTAHSDCGYFAFCDQDDVWAPSKLEHAVEALEQYSSDEPLLYCSAIEYVDEVLGHLSYSKLRRVPSFANALVENVATGCTIVLNKKARQILTAEIPTESLMHDWWCYLVVSAFGRLIYDPRPNIKYRLHQRNAVGAAVGHWNLFWRRVERFWKRGSRDFKFREQARAFDECFGASLDPERRQTLSSFLQARRGLLSRIAYAGQMDVVRQSSFDMAVLRLLVALGRI